MSETDVGGQRCPDSVQNYCVLSVGQNQVQVRNPDTRKPSWLKFHLLSYIYYYIISQFAKIGQFQAENQEFENVKDHLEGITPKKVSLENEFDNSSLDVEFELKTKIEENDIPKNNQDKSVLDSQE